MLKKKNEEPTSSSRSDYEIEIEIEIGPPHLTRYERARVLGARALQLAYGAPVLVEIPETIVDTLLIARKELETKALPISVRRVLPNGKYQDLPVSALFP